MDAIRGLARAIDSAADELQQQSPVVAGAVHEAARGISSLSDNLSNRNVDELVDAAVRLARAQPALFVGGSVAAGFALARFLMSSGRNGRPSGFGSRPSGFDDRPSGFDERPSGLGDRPPGFDDRRSGFHERRSGLDPYQI